MIVTVETCMHCGACAGSCPRNAVFLNDTLPVFGDACNRCGRCVKTCPVGALELEVEE